MADRLIHQPPSEEHDVPVLARRRRRILFAIGAAVFLVVLFLGYTQTEMFGREILRSVQSRIGASSISAESFRMVGTGRFLGADLLVKDQGGEPIFNCRSLDVKFGLLGFLGGRFAVDSIIVDGGELEVLETKEGDTSFGALLSKLSKRRNRSQLALEGIAVEAIQLSDCAIRFRWEERPDALVAFRGLNLVCNDFSAGTDFSVTLDSSLDLVSDESAAISIHAEGTVGLNLKETGFPTIADGLVALSFGAGTGRLSELSEAQGEIKLEIQSEEVGDSGLRLFRETEELGSIMVSGPLDSSRMEGRLGIKTTRLKRPILNLFSVVSGLDFGETTLSSDLIVDWAFGGSVVSARGKIEGSNLEVQKGAARTPKTEFLGEFSFQYSQDDDSLLVQKCQFQASKEGVDWLTGNLRAPVIFSWGDARPGIKEPNFDLQLKDFDMRAWASFFLIELPFGELSFDAVASIRRDGQLIVSKFQGDVKGLEFPTPIGRPVVTDFEFEFAAHLEGMKRLSLIDLAYTCREDGSDLLKGSGVGSFRIDDGSYNFQLVSRGAASRLSEFSGIEGLEIASGEFDAIFRVFAKGDSYDIVLNTGLSDLVGNYSEVVFNDHRIDSKLDVKMVGGQIQFNNFSVQVRKAHTSAGSIRFNGEYDLDAETGKVQFRSVGINRHLFGAMLDSHLQTEQLGEAELKIDGQLDFDRQGESRLKGKIGVSKLKYLGMDGELAKQLDFEVGGDVVISEEKLRLTEGRIQLEGTDRGGNLLQVEAEVPLSLKQNGIVTVRGDALDLTEYWAWYLGIRAASQVPVSSGGEVGVRSLGDVDVAGGGIGSALEMDLALTELYLADLAVTNLVAKSTLGTQASHRIRKKRLTPGDLRCLIGV